MFLDYQHYQDDDFPSLLMRMEDHAPELQSAHCKRAQTLAKRLVGTAKQFAHWYQEGGAQAFALSTENNAHSERVYSLRHRLREAMTELDDEAVAMAVFSHPEVKQCLPELRYYAGICEGEHERFFEARAHHAINKAMQAMPIAAEALAQALGKPGGILPFHHDAFERVDRAIAQELSAQQRKTYLGLEEGDHPPLRHVATKRLHEMLSQGHYSSPLTKHEKLAVLMGLLGEYAYGENYMLLAANELALVESATAIRTPDGQLLAPATCYSEQTAVAFPGAGSLPLTAIFKHVMTGAPMVLIDIDADAITRARDLIARLEHFGIVTPGSLICAEAMSAEAYFDGKTSTAAPITTGFFAGKLGMDGRPLPGQADRVVKVVEMASLLPDEVKFRIAHALSALPCQQQPDVLLCRTTYGKANALYEKVTPLPLCLHYDYRASATPRSMRDREVAHPIRYYHDKHSSQVSGAHVFVRPGYGISTPLLPILKHAAAEIAPTQPALQEATQDTCYAALKADELHNNHSPLAQKFHRMGFGAGRMTPTHHRNWSQRMEEQPSSWTVTP